MRKGLISNFPTGLRLKVPLTAQSAEDLNPPWLLLRLSSTLTSVTNFLQAWQEPVSNQTALLYKGANKRVKLLYVVNGPQNLVNCLNTAVTFLPSAIISYASVPNSTPTRVKKK